MMKPALALTPLAFALALGGLAATPGTVRAQSDWIALCAAGRYEQGAGSPCQQPYQEGLAAVLTGSAQDAAGAWGYIDKQGRMAIAPAYDEAESFQNGLAAVSQGARWGYIDSKGKWAIEPRYSRATGFNAEGTALVEEDGRDVLIDRQGKTIKTFPLGTRTWGFRRGQKLASIEMPAPPRLFNSVSGKAVTLPEGVMALAAPTGGYLPAQLRDTRYGGQWGLLDENGRWAIAPHILQSRDAPMRDGKVLAVRRGDNWQFVDVSGKAISSERYEQVQLVGPGLWLVQRNVAHRPLLLDGKQQTLHRFTNDYAGLQERDGWRYLIDSEAVLLLDPAGKFRKIAVGQGNVDVREGLAWVSGTRPGNAVEAKEIADSAAVAMTRASADDAPADAAEDAAMDASMPGEAVEAADGPEAATQAVADVAVPVSASSPQEVAAAFANNQMDMAVAVDASPPASEAAAAATQAAAGTEISAGGLVQIYARDGKPLLSDETVAQLQAYNVSTFDRDKRVQRRSGETMAPLALLRPNDYSQPLGILTPAGRIVTNKDWEDISTYSVTMPLPVRTRNGKAGAIDAEGNWAVAPRYSEIRPFRAGYAWARPPESTRRRDAVLIDARGQQVALPAAVMAGARDIDGELIAYRQADENRADRWGIWSVHDNAAVLKPAYEHVEKFEDDWAKVQDDNRWGVVNRKGQWVLPATYESAFELDYLGNGFMLVPDAEPQARRGGYSDRAYRLVNLRTGKSSERLSEKPEKLKDGGYVGLLADAGAVLFDTRGGVLQLSDSHPKRKEQYQDWIYIEGEEREGAIDAKGELKVPALYGEFNPFFVQPEGLARAYNGSNYRVIDQTGKTVLGKHGDGTPLATMQRIVFHDDASSSSIMTDLQGREITRIDGTYSVDDNNASEGVVPYRGSRGNGKYGLVDASGKRVVGPHFDALGPLKNGLAVAQRRQRTGKLFGYADLSGRYAIAPVYTWADNFSEGRALTRHKGFTQFIDTKGAAIATFAYVCDTVTILDDSGRITWPQKKMSCPAADKFELAPDNAKAEQS